jgi:cellulose synthase/poly-beta-1,6-N-acetylglucosamine synthase-like glycosyltransferase
MWLTLICAGVALLFLGMSASAVFHLRWAQRLPSIEDLASVPVEPAVCSVVIAARDEAGRIEGTVRRLLAQREVQIEVIVVDDRSSDGTSDIVRRLASEDARLKLLRVDALPADWLGKCHACHLGAEAASGAWLLFTDADCWLKPDVLARAWRVAARERADHIALTPGVAARTAAARAWHIAFLISLANWFSGVNRDRPRAYLGMGAVNLVRTAAYRRCGGYEALRLTVVDDIRLGLLIHRAGFRTRGFIGGDDTECDWGTSVGQMIRIMEKNYFAILDYRLAAALVAGLGGLLTWAAAVAGPISGNAAGFAAGGALLTLIVPARIVTQRLGWPASAAALTPLIYPAMFYAMLRSAWFTMRQGGVRWRETFYPLDLLRRSAVR